MKWLQLFFLNMSLLFFLGCNNKPSSDENIEPNDNYKTGKLYCWCFGPLVIDSIKNKGHAYVSLCTSTMAVRPDHLVDNKYLYVSLAHGETIKKLSRVLLSGEKRIDASASEIDARFVMVFEMNSSSKDLFYYRNEFEMGFNDSTIIRYNFPILDSISKILGKSYIECK